MWTNFGEKKNETGAKYEAPCTDLGLLFYHVVEKLSWEATVIVEYLRVKTVMFQLFFPPLTVPWREKNAFVRQRGLSSSQSTQDPRYA